MIVRSEWVSCCSYVSYVYLIHNKLLIVVRYFKTTKIFHPSNSLIHSQKTVFRIKAACALEMSLFAVSMNLLGTLTIWPRNGLSTIRPGPFSLRLVFSHVDGQFSEPRANFARSW